VVADLRFLADEDLMQLAGDGDVRAFELIFDRHTGLSFSLAYRMCHRRAMAEDVVQDAFLSLWRNAGRYERTRGSVRSWVLTVVHNHAIDALRRARVSDSRDVGNHEIAERLAAPERTETEVVRRDDARRMREALETLPPEQRRAIELAYFHGFTHAQISRVLELPAGTVKGRIRLGLQKLRYALEPGIPASSPTIDGGLLAAARPVAD
jgi:RNA polymerase sigma-70 factor, ECF subfamily